MSFVENTPIEIQNPADTIPTGSSVRDDNKFILTKNIIPALETRMKRYTLNIDRVPTIQDRSFNPLSRFSVETLIGFLEDAAIQVAMRCDSLHLQELITTKNPDFSGNWDFSDCIRVLGGRITVDGSVRAERMSEDKREDMYSSRAANAAAPLYTMEGGVLNVYGGILTNPITASANAILLPTPTTFTATANFVGSNKSITINTGSNFDEDLHELVLLNMSGITFTGQQGRGIISRITSPITCELDMDDDLTPLDGQYSISWKTPAYSMLNETLEEAVVELAASDMFASIPDITAMTGALSTFEKIMERIGLAFFKI